MMKVWRMKEPKEFPASPGPVMGRPGAMIGDQIHLVDSAMELLGFELVEVEPETFEVAARSKVFAAGDVEITNGNPYPVRITVERAG